MSSNAIKCLWVLIIALAYDEVVAQQPGNPVPEVLSCFVTSSVSCEYAYLHLGGGGLPHCGDCGGEFGDLCDTYDEVVYVIPEGGVVEPWAVPSETGLEDVAWDAANRVTCGTKLKCKYYCEQDPSMNYFCDTTVFQVFDIGTSQAVGSECPQAN